MSAHTSMGDRGTVEHFDSLIAHKYGRPGHSGTLWLSHRTQVWETGAQRNTLTFSSHTTLWLSHRTQVWETGAQWNTVTFSSHTSLGDRGTAEHCDFLIAHKYGRPGHSGTLWLSHRTQVWETGAQWNTVTFSSHTSMGDRGTAECGVNARDPYPPNAGPKLRVNYNYKTTTL